MDKKIKAKTEPSHVVGVLVSLNIGMIALTVSTIALADQMVHKFKNPSFSGNNTSSHYLTIELSLIHI